MIDDGGMRTWSHGITLGIGLGLALAGACKDDGDNGPVDEDDAPSEIAKRVCAAYFGCDCEAFNMRFDSMADCETEYAETVQDRIDDGNAAGLTYQAACPGLLLDALDTLHCETQFEVILDDEALAAATEFLQCKLFYGTRAAGEPCEVDPNVAGDECTKDLVCENGTCAVRVEPPEVGETCLDGGPGCPSGSACLDLDADGELVCESLPGAGGTCLGMLDLCGPYLFCDQTDKRCAAVASIGEACTPGLYPCVEGAVCGTDQMCEAAPGAGEPCTFFCAEGLTCDQNVCAVASPVICGFVGTGD